MDNLIILWRKVGCASVGCSANTRRIQYSLLCVFYFHIGREEICHPCAPRRISIVPSSNLCVGFLSGWLQHVNGCHLPGRPATLRGLAGPKQLLCCAWEGFMPSVYPKRV